MGNVSGSEDRIPLLLAGAGGTSTTEPSLTFVAPFSDVVYVVTGIDIGISEATLPQSSSAKAFYNSVAFWADFRTSTSGLLYQSWRGELRLTFEAIIIVEVSLTAAANCGIFLTGYILD